MRQINFCKLLRVSGDTERAETLLFLMEVVDIFIKAHAKVKGSERRDRARGTKKGCYEGGDYRSEGLFKPSNWIVYKVSKFPDIATCKVKLLLSILHHRNFPAK